MHKPAGNKIDSLLASIEGLHAQANHADGGHQPSVAPDTAKSDVVHLDTVLARRTEENRQRPQASGQTTQKTPRIEEDDFDANLARLMQDITAQTPGKKDKPVLRTRASLEDFKKQETGQPRQTPYLDSADGDSPNDIRTEIDSLLAPYLDKSSSKVMARSAQPRRRPIIRQNHPPSGRVCRYQGKNNCQPAYRRGFEGIKQLYQAGNQTSDFSMGCTKY